MALQICLCSYSMSLSHTSHLHPCRIAGHTTQGVLRVFYSSVPRKDGGGRRYLSPILASCCEVHHSIPEELSSRGNLFYKEQQMGIRQGSRLRQSLLNFSHKIFPFNGHLLSAGHRTDLDDPFFQFLLTNNDHQWNACALTIVQLG